MKKIILGLLMSVSMAARVFAAGDVQIVEGKDYTLATAAVPASVVPKGKVDVKEFFYYSCVHCKAVEPMVEKDLLNNKGIQFEKIPVVWGDNPTLTNFAKFSATLRLLNLDKLDLAAFNNVSSKNNFASGESQLKSFLAQNGLKSEQVDQFVSTYNSFTVNSKIAEYKEQMEGYNVEATPTFIVADIYKVTPAQPERMMQVIQALVTKVNTKK